jgi:DNA-binding transcriptional regulator YdaS (Cro superfamily)
MSDDPIRAEVLRKYLNSLDPEDQESYAKRCETTVGYLRKAISAKQRIAESTAILLERESGGAVPVESIRPDVDWGYLRGTSKRSRLTTSRRCG